MSPKRVCSGGSRVTRMPRNTCIVSIEIFLGRCSVDAPINRQEDNINLNDREGGLWRQEVAGSG